jgi:hypothetical protein
VPAAEVVILPGSRSWVGRAKECTRIDELLDPVRKGSSGALVVRGEAGVGKTALLDDLTDRADGCGVVRVAAVRSEMELAVAVLRPRRCLMAFGTSPNPNAWLSPARGTSSRDSSTRPASTSTAGRRLGMAR